MSEWKEYKLKDLTEPVKETYNPDGSDEYTYIGLEHIEQETLRLNSVGISSDVTSNKFKFKPNDVLFGKLRPYFRKVVQPKFGGICSTDIWVFRAKEGFKQNFLFYFIANWDFVNTANGAESGTRMPRADWNFLKATEWLLPPLPEQTTIAEILSSLDDKINLLHRQNLTLEQLAETLFRQWFVEEAKESWEEKGLDEIAEFLNGLACQKFPRKLGEIGLPVIKIKEMRTGITDASDWATADVPEKYIIENGDMLFSWSGSLDIVLWFGGKGVLNQHLFKVSSEIYPQWFYYFWTQFHLQEFKGIADDKATTMGHIQRHHLSDARVVVPSNEELQKMDKTVNPIFQKIKSNTQQIRTLTHLRDTLLPKLMSGEVRVNLN